jgi:hypothetical protein
MQNFLESLHDVSTMQQPKRKAHQTASRPSFLEFQQSVDGFRDIVLLEMCGELCYVRPLAQDG